MMLPITNHLVLNDYLLLYNYNIVCMCAKDNPYSYDIVSTSLIALYNALHAPYAYNDTSGALPNTFVQQ